MKVLVFAFVSTLVLCMACGSNSKGSSVAQAPTLGASTPLAGGTAVPTTRLGTRPPGATARPAVSAAGSPSAGILPVPPGTPPLQTTASGLQFQDIVAGTGAQPQAGQTVTVNYTGWLNDGTKFDSSLDRNQPFGFVLGKGQVIKGWDEGLATMKVGGKRRLVIPPGLGYGAQANGKIPANSQLTFDVELVDVK